MSNQKKSVQHMPQANEDGFVPTLNQTGYMTSELDAYSSAFVKFAANQDAPVLEIGAAYGVATLAALKEGASVYANDLDKKHLDILCSRTPESYKQNLKLVPGSFPNDIHFDEATFSAILACRVFHFFDGETIEEGLKKCFHWLKPGGKIYIVSETPYLKSWRSYIPVYEEKVAAGELWPGFIEKPSDYNSNRIDMLPPHVNWLDDTVLKRVLKSTGFNVEKVGYIDRVNFPDDMRLSGKESVGIIGIKPMA